MGKSNRIRVNRANQKVQSLGVGKKPKKGMPSWLMTLITLVVAIAILLGIAVSLLSANGVFNRMRTSVESDNFKVTNNMMSYYFYTQYNTFYSNYSSLMSSFSLDTSLSLKDQPFGGVKEDGSTDTTYLDYILDSELAANPDATWFDYFMKQTLASVEQLLVYCEEAEARGIADLTEEETQEIEASLDSLESTAAAYGYTLDSYISNMYGPGVKATDLRKAMKLSTIAARCMNEISEELDTAIKGNIDAAISGNTVETTFKENASDIYVLDYLSYTFEVDYDDIVEEVMGKSDATDAEIKEKEADILEAYKQAIADAKAKADALKALTSVADFEKAVLEEVAPEFFDTAYGKQTVAAEDKPSDEDYEAIKTALIADVIAEVMEGKEETAELSKAEDGTVTAYGKTVNEPYLSTLNTVKETLFTDLSEEKAGLLNEKASFVNDNNDEKTSFPEWAFDFDNEDAAEAKRVANETIVMVEGDGEGDAEVAKEDGYSYVTAYFVKTPQYLDTEKTRNVAYMLFSTKDAAQTAIDELKAKGELTFDIFEEYAQASTTAAGHSELEDYVEGTIGSSVFDEWVYGEDTALGDLTATPVELDSSTYAVIYYHAEGKELWYVNLNEALLTEDFDARYTELEAKYAVTSNEKAYNKIEA